MLIYTVSIWYTAVCSSMRTGNKQLHTCGQQVGGGGGGGLTTYGLGKGEMGVAY